MSEAEAFATIALAADAGVTLVDIPAQADAERVLGEVAPRTASLRIVAKTGARLEDADMLERRARSTLSRLGRTDAYALVVSEASSLLGPGGPALWARMKRLKDEGLFQATGVCACVCDDPAGLARRFRPDLMQLPASLLDQRLVADGTLETVAGLGIEIHLRSVFVQGLLFLGSHALPADLAAMTPGLSHVRRTLAQAGVDPLQAALGFALSRPEASRVIVGVASPSELRAVLAAAATPVPELAWESLALAAPCAIGPRRCATAA